MVRKRWRVVCVCACVRDHVLMIGLPVVQSEHSGFPSMPDNSVAVLVSSKDVQVTMGRGVVRRTAF